MASRWIEIWASLGLKSEDKEAGVLASLIFDFYSDDYSVLKKWSWFVPENCRLRKDSIGNTGIENTYKHFLMGLSKKSIE